MSRLNSGSKIQTFKIHESYSVQDFYDDYPKALVLFYITHKGRLVMVSEGTARNRLSVNVLIALV